MTLQTHHEKTKNHKKHRFIDLIKLLKTPDGLISLGFGSGCITKAPGTFGTIFAFISGTYLSLVLTNSAFLLLIIIGFFVGLLAIEKTGERLGEHDSSHIVWDEIIAFWFVMCCINISPNNVYMNTYSDISDSLWFYWIFAFILFRFFDIVKPLGIKKIDRKYQNALGVMADDILAAIYTLIVIIFSVFLPFIYMAFK